MLCTILSALLLQKKTYLVGFRIRKIRLCLYFSHLIMTLFNEASTNLKIFKSFYFKYEDLFHDPTGF